MTFQSLLSDLRKRLELSIADGTFTGTEIARLTGVAQANVFKSRQYWTRLIAIEGSQDELLVIDRYLYSARRGRFVMLEHAIQQGRLISDRNKTWFCPDDLSKDFCNKPIVIGRIVLSPCHIQ